MTLNFIITLLITYIYIYITDCSNSPCQQGTCRNELNGYNCSCYQGFTGQNCDQGTRYDILWIQYTCYI